MLSRTRNELSKTRKNACTILLCVLVWAILLAACASKQAENPFSYPYVKPLVLKRQPGKPYSDYKAFYLLTEDFEPLLELPSDIDQIRQVLQLASELSARHHVPWTHFVDVSTLAPAFISDDREEREKCLQMIGDLKSMVSRGDDCQMHLHGAINSRFLDYLESQQKLHVKRSGVEEIEGYRQRKSFFFNSFYAQGYWYMVKSLTYGKRALENVVYDGKPEVLAFRAGGWDHGSSGQDTFIYFNALLDAGFAANSGLSKGEFGGSNFSIGNAPPSNLATVQVGERSILEISPTNRPGGYVNPVVPDDLLKLAGSGAGQMPVIVSVYHLSSLQRSRLDAEGKRVSDSAELKQKLEDEARALEAHFKTVAELQAQKVLYPITLRQLIAILSEP